MKVAIIHTLICQTNSCQEKSLQDLPTSSWVTGCWLCSSHRIHVAQVWWCQSHFTGLEGWFDNTCYRKIKETNNTYQCLSHISLKVVFHSALNNVLSKSASKYTKRWVFHHFPRARHPWPNRCCWQEGFFYIYSLICRILNFIPLLLVKPNSYCPK